MPGYDDNADEAKWDEAFDVVANWRASHNWPLLSTRLTLSARATVLNDAAIITQRLKRLPTIVGKLARFEHMKLTQMQDLGGCRAIMPTVRQVERLAHNYREAARQRKRHQPECIETYDYLKHPKDDGYRGIHFVYKYHSRDPKYAKHDGLRIELQLRTQLQHAWATALEAIDLFTKQALKSNIGDPAWQRFFLLMSAAIAVRERRRPPPGVPEDQATLTQELGDLATQLKVDAVLKAGGAVVEKFIAGKGIRSGVFLLTLDADANELELRHYPQAETRQATEDYEALERGILTGSKKQKQAVLVSAQSLIGLRTGYLGFFKDTTAFLEAMHHAIGGAS